MGWLSFLTAVTVRTATTLVIDELREARWQEKYETQLRDRLHQDLAREQRRKNESEALRIVKEADELKHIHQSMLEGEDFINLLLAEEVLAYDRSQRLT